MSNPKGCWRVCAGTAMILFCVLGLMINGFSIYLPLLTEHCALSNTQTSVVVTTRSIASLLVILLFTNTYYKKIGLRLGMVLTVLVAAAALVGFAFSGGFAGLCISSMVGGIAQGLLGNMYAAALLIRRWFRNHLGVALGVASASTGLAPVVGAPLVTWLVQCTSLKAALIVEAAAFTVFAVLSAVLIPKHPQEASVRDTSPSRDARFFRVSWPMIIMAILGALGGPGLQFMSMHYTWAGFSAVQVTALVSLLGGALMIGKFLFGEAADRWGAYHTNVIFFGAAILGCVLFCIPIGYGGAVISVVLYGFGLSFCTVGLSLYAKDLSSPEEYEGTLRGYQILYQVGVVAFGTVPGVLADWTGNYIVFYVLMGFFGLTALLVIQHSYKKKGVS